MINNKKQAEIMKLLIDIDKMFGMHFHLDCEGCIHYPHGNVCIRAPNCQVSVSYFTVMSVVDLIKEKVKPILKVKKAKEVSA